MLIAAQAVSRSKCDASTSDTLAQGVSAKGVTSCQVLPPSRVTWIRPSSVPTHNKEASSGEGATL